MKIKYTLDPNNRFTIVKDRNVLRPAGYFSVNKYDQLIYQVKESSAWRKKYDIPERVTLTGKWGLDKDHNLNFLVQKTDAQKGGERLYLSSEIKSVNTDSIVFSLGTLGKAGTQDTRLLQLKGKWQADKHNRLQFLIQKTRLTSDTLTFQAAWQVKNNELIYAYKKTGLKTKTKQSRTLRFKGYWEINDKNRISYILDAKTNSSFSFKAFLETPSLIGKKGEIKYRVGIGVKGTRAYSLETITLYGVWKLGRKTGLSFDLETSDGKIKAIPFGAFVQIDKNSKATFKLMARKGRPLGMSVEFSQAFMKDNAEWFVRAVREGSTRLEGGIHIRW